MAYDPRQWLGYSSLYDDDETGSRFQSSSVVNDKETLAADTSEVINDEGENEQNYSHNQNCPEKEQSDFIYCTPSAVTSNTEEKEDLDPQRLEFYISSFQKFIRTLSADHKRKLPYDVICQLAHAVLDGTVFEIAKGLQDIQALTEKNIYEKRMKFINEQKGIRNEMKKRHQKELLQCQNRPHQTIVKEKQINEEKKIFRQNFEKELVQLDQKLMLEIDQQVSDQQATLQRAGLPFFFITNNPDEIRLQMIILEFIIKLSDISSF